MRYYRAVYANYTLSILVPSSPARTESLLYKIRTWFWLGENQSSYPDLMNYTERTVLAEGCIRIGFRWRQVSSFTYKTNLTGNSVLFQDLDLVYLIRPKSNTGFTLHTKHPGYHACSKYRQLTQRSLLSGHQISGLFALTSKAILLPIICLVFFKPHLTFSSFGEIFALIILPGYIWWLEGFLDSLTWHQMARIERFDRKFHQSICRPHGKVLLPRRCWLPGDHGTNYTRWVDSEQNISSIIYIHLSGFSLATAHSLMFYVCLTSQHLLDGRFSKGEPPLASRGIRFGRYNLVLILSSCAMRGYDISGT